MIQFPHNALPIEIPELLRSFIVEHVKKDGLTTINLRDSTYHPTSGGFRPVEIMVEKKGHNISLVYVTEFRYFGEGTYAELGKSLDFDFQNNRYYDRVKNSELATKHNSLFELLTNNFISYSQLGLFDQLEITHCDGNIML